MQANTGHEAIEIRDVVKVYGRGEFSFTALKGATLNIQHNEFFTLLGPSGCGKTTLLRLIAGFEAVTEGEIFLYGEEIESLPPDRRPINTVFQHYALFPHMTVAENVAFGLKRLKKPKSEITATVEKMLTLVHLDQFASRHPHQLSGGQQQRVALARALAPNPKVLLLDEPLSALDLKLRQAMREELQRIQREAGITFVFVTHDQEEALAMSDRIAVMSQGEIRQIGSPEDIYLRPVNRFVADFIGDTNFIDVEVARVAGASVQAKVGKRLMLTVPNVEGIAEGGTATLGVRPENVVVTLPGNGVCNARIVGRTYLGAASTFTLKLDEGIHVEARRNNRIGRTDEVMVGEEVGVEFADDSIAVLTS